MKICIYLLFEIIHPKLTVVVGDVNCVETPHHFHAIDGAFMPLRFLCVYIQWCCAKNNVVRYLALGGWTDDKTCINYLTITFIISIRTIGSRILWNLSLGRDARQFLGVLRSIDTDKSRFDPYLHCKRVNKHHYFSNNFWKNDYFKRFPTKENRNHCFKLTCKVFCNIYRWRLKIILIFCHIYG